MKRLIFCCLLLCACNTTPGGGDGGGTDDMGTPIGPRPGARKDIDGVLIPTTRQLIVVGGDTAPFDNNVPVGQLPKAYIDETWRLDIANSKWEKLTSASTPGARGGYAVAFDSKRGRVLLFAGRLGSGMTPPAQNDLWALDATSFMWSKLSPTGTLPSKRTGHRMIYDPTGDRLIVYSGEPNNLFDAGAITGDTWELSFAAGADGAWNLLVAAGAAGAPAKRRDPAFAYDGKRKLVVMFGGAFSFDMYTQETWVFDLSNNTWRKLTNMGLAPSARFAGKMDYDAARDRFVIFGGHDPFTIGLQNDSATMTLDAGATTATFDLVLGGDTGIRDPSLVDHKSPERRQRHAQIISGDQLLIFGGGTDCSAIDDLAVLDLTAPTTWSAIYPAQIGETCSRRATSGQQCPSDCGAPF